jgi:hypothetical protein
LTVDFAATDGSFATAPHDDRTVDCSCQLVEQFDPQPGPSDFFFGEHVDLGKQLAKGAGRRLNGVDKLGSSEFDTPV